MVQGRHPPGGGPGPSPVASAISQRRKRKLIEQAFGWVKTVRRIRQVMVRGLRRVDQMLVLSIDAYNLARMRSPLPPVSDWCHGKSGQAAKSDGVD